MLAPALSVRVRLYLQLRREPEEHVRTLSSHPVLCGTYQSSVIRDMHSDVSALRLHPCPLVGHPSIQSSALQLQHGRERPARWSTTEKKLEELLYV